MQRHVWSLALRAISALTIMMSALTQGMSQPFTYQGLLKDGGNPANGNYQMTFRLFSVAGGGTALATVGPVSVSVSNGLFTVNLDFGNVWTGDDRYLEIQVGSTTLSPRVKINPTPYAAFAFRPWITSGADIYYTAGNVGIGTGSPLARLHVATSAGGRAIYGLHTATSGYNYGVYGQSDSYGGYGVYGIATATNGSTYGVIGQSASPDGTGVYGWAAATSGTNYGVRGVSSSPNGYGGYFVGRGYFSGNVGIGTSNPDYRLDVNGRARIQGTTGANTAGIWYSNGTANRAFIGLLDDNHVGFWGEAGAGWHLLMNTVNGNVGIGRWTLLVETAKLNVFTDSNIDHATLRLHETAADFARLEFTNTNTARKWHIAGFVGSAVTDDRLNFWNSQAGDIMSIRGDGTVSVKVLEITGADLAEKFPTTDIVEPGMVVEIDPDHPGNLRKARGAYNKRVVGVVAGANGLSKGIVLGNLEGSEHHTPIAMSGRVWVYADAAEHAIEPGDFLTTAERPGYAMKADDLAKAQGAIIGKAMTRLEKGKTGMVLVVVNLQ